MSRRKPEDAEIGSMLSEASRAFSAPPGVRQEIRDRVTMRLSSGNLQEVPLSHRRMARWSVGAVAASFLLVLTASLVWMLADRSTSVPSSPAYVEVPAELQDRIDREGVAARMLAAANLLARQPGGEETAQERYADILLVFRDTSAARQVPALRGPGVRRNPT